MRRVVEVGWEAGAGDVQLVYRDEYERRLHALHASDELLDRTTAWLETAILSMEGQRWSSYSATRTPTLPRCRSGTGGSCRTATRSRDRPRSDVPSRDRLEHHRRPHRGLGQRRARAAGSGAALAGKWRPSRDSTSRTRSRRGGSASPRSTHAAPRCTPRRSTGFTSPAPERISRSGCCRRPLGRRRRDDVLGPDLRRQPADGGSLHDPGPLRTEGTVRTTKPLHWYGSVADEIELRFEGGRVVEARAGRGEDFLRSKLETDDGASYLGEVALVDGTSRATRSALQERAARRERRLPHRYRQRLHGAHRGCREVVGRGAPGGRDQHLHDPH
jgi:Thermophilic metalloprotease (M29)